MIDFTARLYGLRNYQAAQKLAQDFGVNADSMHEDPTTTPARQTGEKARMCQKTLDNYARLLRGWKNKYAPWSPESELDVHFVEACCWLDYVEYLADSLAFSNPKQRMGWRTHWWRTA